jgi:hypothetical protein
VEARKSGPAAPAMKPCCPEEQNCGGEHRGAANSPCCSSKIENSAPAPSDCKHACCSEKPADACPECASRSSQKRCDQPNLTRPVVSWIVGIFAMKCRGEGPTGLLHHAPAVPSDVMSHKLAADHPAGDVVVVPIRVTSSSHRPPTPPPRFS